MKKSIATILALGALLLLASPAQADWIPGDGHKMHFPQLPDPNGLDVNFVAPIVLADDWLCSKSGPVADIHFWFSGRNNIPPDIENIHVRIHTDIPLSDDNPFSRPGELLWESDFNASEFNVLDWGNGDQGWLDPESGEFIDNDHDQFYQVNIEEIVNPFIQKRGTVYWLELSVKSPTSPDDTAGMFGWKTSLQHFLDAAVWTNPDTGIQGWQPLMSPRTGQPIDLSFVITPEPGTTTMLLGAVVGLLAWASQRRKS